MIRTFINSFKISYAESANQFIYFLKRVPFLGKKVPEKLYKQTNAKQILGIISYIFGIIGEFFKKSLYLCLLILLPASLIAKTEGRVSFIFFHILFFMSFIIGSLMKSTVFNKLNKPAFNMVVLMKADAKEYYVGEILYKNLSGFIYFVLPAIVIGSIIGFSPAKAIVLIVELICFRFMGEFIHIYIYNHKKIILTDSNVFMFIIIIGGIFLAYAVPVMGFTLNLSLVLFNIAAEVIIFILGTCSFIYLLKYNNYTPISKIILTKDNLFRLETVSTNMKFGDVKLDEKKMSKEDLNNNKYNKKEGYEYLNALFFQRHRKIMVTPIKIRLGITAIVFLVCMYLVLFIPQSKETVLQQIQKSTPFFVFIMYIMSTGERTCKAMFYNCDVSLLRYAYYRESRVILHNFTSRLKRVVMLNIIPAAAICIALFAVMLLSGSFDKIIGTILLSLCILCLACFFSIHHLFMYYVIQPYTAELTVKSPLYKIINVVMYFICYSCLQIKTTSSYFTLGVLIITIVYMIFALLLTYRLAPKTFKLK